MSTAISLGCTGCPNDLFCFEYLPEECGVELCFHDIETLNGFSDRCQGPPVLKISAAALPRVSQHYELLQAGAAFSFSHGPYLVANRPMSIEEAYQQSILIPGLRTSAYAALRILCGGPGNIVEIPTAEILSLVCRSQNPLVGVVIHEPSISRVPGLYQILDIGQTYRERYGCLLPLGVLVARKTLGQPLIHRLEHAVARSVQRAQERPILISPFVRQGSMDRSDRNIEEHIQSYVGPESQRLGMRGLESLRRFEHLSAYFK